MDNKYEHLKGVDFEKYADPVRTLSERLSAAEAERERLKEALASLRTAIRAEPRMHISDATRADFVSRIDALLYPSPAEAATEGDVEVRVRAFMQYPVPNGPIRELKAEAATDSKCDARHPVYGARCHFGAGHGEYHGAKLSDGSLASWPRTPPAAPQRIQRACGALGGRPPHTVADACAYPEGHGSRVGHSWEQAAEPTTAAASCSCVHAPEQHGETGCLVYSMKGKHCPCGWTRDARCKCRPDEVCPLCDEKEDPTPPAQGALEENWKRKFWSYLSAGGKRRASGNADPSSRCRFRAGHAPPCALIPDQRDPDDDSMPADIAFLSDAIDRAAAEHAEVVKERDDDDRAVVDAVKALARAGVAHAADGTIAAGIARLAEHRDGCAGERDRYFEAWGKASKQRDAALARVAELEAQVAARASDASTECSCCEQEDHVDGVPWFCERCWQAPHGLVDDLLKAIDPALAAEADEDESDLRAVVAKAIAKVAAPPIDRLEAAIRELRQMVKEVRNGCL